MKKFVSFFGILICLIFLSCCGSDNMESIERSNIDNNSNLTTNVLQSDWEYLDIGVFNDNVFETNEVHFLITEEVSLEGQVYKTEGNNTSTLLELFQNLHVKKINGVTSCADYYVLFRDENDTATCLIEVWDGYICINQRNFYEVFSDELYLAIAQIISECKELSKIPAEEVLLIYTNDYLQGEYMEEDIVLYNNQPAILVESGYENNYSEEKYICCNGLYFDIDYQTTYMLSECKIFYNEDGSMQDSYNDRAAYYDYFNGKRILFDY